MAQPQSGCNSKEIPLIQVAYPNENKSHIIPVPVTGTPGVNPCCKPSPCPGYNENPSLCEPIACTAGVPCPTNPGACYDSQTLHQRQCECDKCICERLNFQDDGKTCFQHVDGNKWQDLKRRYFDPDVECLKDKLRSSEMVRENLKWCPTDDSLTSVVRKFRQYPVGILGQATVHYGAAQDADYPKKLIHGAMGDEPTPAAKLINPPPLKWVDQLDLDIKESIYYSNKRGSIGKSHDQSLRLPPELDVEDTMFGRPSDKSINVRQLVNPPRTRQEIAEETKQHKPLYRFTHGEYDPGEQICRNYTGNFRRTNTFGIPTPNDVAGRLCKKVIGTWRTCQPDPPYVSKVYADHLDFRYPKLGLPQEQNCIRTKQGDNFMYGKRSGLGVEPPTHEIMFNRCRNPGAEKAAKIMHNLKNWLDKVRKKFKSQLGPDYEIFYEELQSTDKDCVGKITWDAMTNAFNVHRVPISMSETDFMEALAYVQVFIPQPEDRVDYFALMDLIKGYMDPQFHCRTTTLKPYYCPHTNGCGNHFQTMYKDMTKNLCEPQDCVTQRKEAYLNGVPSIRTDKVPLKIESTQDTTNYGDSGDAYSLIWPSVYTVNGVTARDAFREMTKDEMCKLLAYAKVDFTREELDATWEIAKTYDPEGLDRVCYQTFRESLCRVREENARAQNCHISYQTLPCLTGDPENFRPGPDGEHQVHGKGRRCRNPCAGVDP